MSNFNSPLRYPGGKNCIFPFVSKLFHENEIIGISYAEPYAGGAGLALRLLYDEYVSHIYLNDLDRSIYSFWKVVTERNDEFCSWVSDVEINMDNWLFYRGVQRSIEPVDMFELAKSTFFLNRTNVSGVIKGGVIGGFEQHGKYKIDARFKKDELINRLRKIDRYKHRISISNLDGIEFISRLDKRKENIFIYIDPPYFLKGSDLYMNFYSKDDHKKVANRIKKMKKRWLVSYDDNDFILNLYASNRKYSYSLSQSTSNRVGRELLIFSDALVHNESISSLREVTPHI